jgi:hypothetical protein
MEPFWSDWEDVFRDSPTMRKSSRVWNDKRAFVCLIEIENWQKRTTVTGKLDDHV